MTPEENLISSIVHEQLHYLNPGLDEDTIVKMEIQTMKDNGLIKVATDLQQQLNKMVMAEPGFPTIQYQTPGFESSAKGIFNPTGEKIFKFNTSSMKERLNTLETPASGST